ncbi:hypothetical protein ACQPZP_18405 [Spirillospora sp. CA-142024]|uniref:hypothetical protein n=1 Tax=Spirillospora sp. CA-142024 TaxID=3240036 RepID=UPI003D8E9829
MSTYVATIAAPWPNPTADTLLPSSDTAVHRAHAMHLLQGKVMKKIVVVAHVAGAMTGPVAVRQAAAANSASRVAASPHVPSQHSANEPSNRSGDTVTGVHPLILAIDPERSRRGV